MLLGPAYDWQVQLGRTCLIARGMTTQSTVHGMQVSQRSGTPTQYNTHIVGTSQYVVRTHGRPMVYGHDGLQCVTALMAVEVPSTSAGRRHVREDVAASLYNLATLFIRVYVTTLLSATQPHSLRNKRRAGCLLGTAALAMWARDTAS